MPYVAKNPRFFEKQSVGSGQCVAFVQAAALTGHTSGWVRGEPVRDSQLLPGTAIATFSDSGKYENDTHGRSHAAIYLSQDSSGIKVLDQWMSVAIKPDGTKEVLPHVVSERTIPFKAAPKAANDARKYFIIE